MSHVRGPRKQLVLTDMPFDQLLDLQSYCLHSMKVKNVDQYASKINIKAINREITRRLEGAE